MNYLSVIVEDNYGRPFHMGYQMTWHAKERVMLRRIKEKDLELALLNGICHYKQGFCFYVLENRIVVVVDENKAEIITAYRGKNLNVHIRKKGKTLKRAA